jgi:hypothetical protein
MPAATSAANANFEQPGQAYLRYKVVWWRRLEQEPAAYMDPNDNGQLEYRSADTSGLGFAGGGDPYKYIETGHYAKIPAREDQIVHGWVDGASATHSAKQGVDQALASIKPAGGAAAVAAEQHAAKMRALHRVAVAERFAHGIMLDDGGHNETGPDTMRVLCFGDSLTAGYYDNGRRFHPYASEAMRLLGVKIDHVGLCGYTPCRSAR